MFSDSDGEVEQQIQNTDSEQSNGGDVELQLNPQIRPDNVRQVNRANAITYTSKDRLINWYAHDPTPSTNTRTIRQNIVNILPGVKHIARDKSTILNCWQFYFPNDMIEEIVRCTNQQLTVIRQAYTHGQRYVTDTDVLEIKAFFAVLYLAGVKKGNHLNIEELWSNDSTCPELFSAVMSKRRFQTLV